MMMGSQGPKGTLPACCCLKRGCSCGWFCSAPSEGIGLACCVEVKLGVDWVVALALDRELVCRSSRYIIR